MARLTAAEKQRNYRKRRDADPLRRQEYLLKEQEKYKCDVEAGKKKHVANMTDREKRSARKKWRNYKRDIFQPKFHQFLANETILAQASIRK
ncbi:hypothetical protein RRG08_005180 [Elysia crispata]|uniref:Uncharacterized protein n=1 Tax=Elysia crispata TaxID=231223 RepID=A0AAE0ZH66_9GAST|nr:hypothetical protein RRG08_005180 [Elysia crispata]